MEINEVLTEIKRYIILSTKEALTVKELAIMLDLSEDRIRHLVCDNKIPYYKNGSKVYFKKSEIEDYMLQNRIPTTDEINAQAASYCLRNR